MHTLVDCPNKKQRNNGKQGFKMLSEAKPKFFIYENNKSMSKEIRAAITECFGFEPTEINSALVSAQNRQRLYWVGRRNADGTYSKVNVEQPEDRGILLKDVLDSAVPIIENAGGKSFALTSTYYKLCNSEYDVRHNYERHQRSMAAERVPDYAIDKSRPLSASYSHKSDGEGSVKCDGFPDNPNKQVFDFVAEPVCVAQRGRMYRGESQHYEARDDGKTNTLTSVEKDNRVAEPLQVGAMPRPNGELSTSQAFRVYGIENKSVTINSGGGGAGGKTGLYAIPYEIEFDENGKPIKAIGKDGKQITVYEVCDGQITIKGKQYPIKLRDGYYIIRKLTVTECKRLQTVPEWYDFSCVSNSQAYKMLGNGWTCEVIKHLINSCLNEKETDFDEQCKLF